MIDDIDCALLRFRRQLRRDAEFRDAERARKAAERIVSRDFALGAADRYEEEAAEESAA